MTSEAWILLIILVVNFSLLIFTDFPPIAIFLGALILTITLHLQPLHISLLGFANPGVLTIGVLFIIGAGRYSMGAITMVTKKIFGSPRSLLETQVRMLPPVAFGSAFLNNTPLVAMVMPVIRDFCKATGFSPSKLYIPLSYASIIGGAVTLIGTSTNLIIAEMVS